MLYVTNQPINFRELCFPDKLVLQTVSWKISLLSGLSRTRSYPTGRNAWRTPTKWKSFNCLPLQRLRGRPIEKYDWFSRRSCRDQFGSMPVLEEAKTMVYVTNHNMITMAMVIFKTYKMADKGEERVLTEILVYSCFIEPFICLLLTMNWEVPWGQGVTILAL